MTKEEFLETLKAYVKDGRLSFRIIDSTDIRSTDNRCPICAVSYLKGGPNNYENAFKSAEHLGINEAIRRHIVNAADWIDIPGREELMEACGLL